MTTKMSMRAGEDERMRLAQQINEWNANRYDLFAISLPNEENEFFGVMRFFFQETGARVSTKCIRVSNTASVQDVLNTLVEKFRPDMRMLTLPRYALYEVHVNGEERKLREDEYPLVVQLNWGKDDREGRFLLKNMDEKTALPKNDSITNTTENPAPEQPGFRRKLSKREKKEAKKREKEAKLKDKENKSPGQELYKEVPDTSFTRSISNPEAVMRRRRQLKLEKKLQQIRSEDGGPDKGGTLKIYGDSIHPDVPYKTLLLSMQDTVAFVVKETLDKYGMEKEDPENYCLVQVLLPPGGPEYHGPGWGGHKEYILDDDDCPLAIVMHTPPSKGTVMFQLKRRPGDMPKKRKKRSSSASRMDSRDRREEPYRPPMQQQQQQQQPPPQKQAPPQDKLPFLVEINPDGSEPYKARRFPLPPNGSEVGSEPAVAHNGSYMQLHGPDVYPRHCVFTFTEGLVTVTPIQREAATYVNDQRIQQTTMLQHGMVVRFGKMHLFRFCDPLIDMAKQQGPAAVKEALQRRGEGPMDPRQQPPSVDAANFETTFDVDGHIETKTGPPGYLPADAAGHDDQLPCSLEYKEEGEDVFLKTVIADINPNMVNFKLAPTYVLYMAMRFRIHKLLRMDMNPGERDHWINTFGSKIVNVMQRTLQESRDNAPSLSFWMANSSELLHFLKQDGDLAPQTKPTQDHLAQVVQMAFHSLVDCMQADLHQVMPAFLDESMDDLQNEDDMGPNMYPSKGKPTIGDVLQVLGSAMSLLRRCRVNAALTIQLFSQLFHFINMWLFNQVVLHPQMQLCTAAWGHRLKRRLGRIEIWAEKHGLELAADCHLARIIQAAHLLEAPKSNPDDIANISSTCFKLNSLQLRTLLEGYIPSPSEPRIPPELISRVVSVAQSMSDELLRSEGRDVRLEEEPDLQLPFLLPEDGYSCDNVKGVPNGLVDFLAPVATSGLCRLNMNNNSSGQWTSYMNRGSQQNLQMGGPGTGPTPPPEGLPPGLPPEPEVIKVTFKKVKGSIGLSIVAAKGERQRDRGIYVKSVVPEGGAALDGRLQAGDQLLKVDGNSLVGLTQERAAEHMMHTGNTVTLEVAKQAAIYHGLTSLLSQPSPVMARASPNRGGPPPQQQQQPPPSKPRPVSEYGAPPDSPRRDDPAWDPMERQKPLHLQHGARSSPNIPSGRPQDQPTAGESGPYGAGYGNQPQHPAPQHPPQGKQPPGQKHMPPGGPQFRPDPREVAIRSRSTTHIDQSGSYEPREQDPRHAVSVSTLPRLQQNQPPQKPQQQRYPSHPDLNRYDDRGDPRNKTYENYPQGPRPSGQPQPQQGPQGDIRKEREQQREIKTAQSMGNIRQEPPPKQDMSSRPRSEEFDRRQMQDWQQQQRPGDNQRPGPGPYGPPQGANRGQPTAQDREIPRSKATPQNQQQGFYKNTKPQNQEPEPQFEHQRRHDVQIDNRGKPHMESQPVPVQRQVPHQQEVPRTETDPRKTQPHFYDHRQGPPPPQQQRGPQGSYQGQGQPGHPPSGPGYPQNRPQQPQQLRMPGSQGPPSAPSPARPYDPRDRSPDLPPPPANLSPGHEYPEDLPPPPPTTQENEQQIKDEQEKMMKRWDSLGRGQAPPNQTRVQPEPQRGPPRSGPGPQQSWNQPSPQTYQNLPPNSRPNQPQPQSRSSQPEQESQSSDHQYHYAPRPAPAQPVDKNIMDLQRNIETDVTNQIRKQTSIVQNGQSPRSQTRPQSESQPPPIRKKPAPPIASKPRISTGGSVSGQSPWEREQKEKAKKQQEEDIRNKRQHEITVLESRQYLSPEEQERLRRLTLDHEFDKRVLESGDRDDDSDTEMTDRAVGRAKVLQLMQRDVERRQQQSEEDKQQQQLYEVQAEAERIERQERRLAQFDQEREEQKQRQLKRQEQKVQETEEYLRKQRELRERQRKEFEEQRRIQKLEEEKMMERQREEIRQKKLMEKEQLREIQAAREEEERNMREAVRRQENEASRQRVYDRMQERESNLRREMERQDKYAHLAYIDQSDPPSRATPPTPNGAHPSTNNAQEDSSQRLGPPAPPERKSSYDIYNNKSGSMSNLEQPDHDMPGLSAQSRSMSASALRQQQQQQQAQQDSYSKKSVSFDTNIATEIHVRNYGSTSSESSYREYQSQMSQEGRYPPQPAPAASQVSAPPPVSSNEPQPFQRPSYGQTPPVTPANNVGYQDSTPSHLHTPTLNNNTPGVIGAQEVYRDPRDRIAASKVINNNAPGSEPQRLSFRDKMKMFAKEAGEHTPQDRVKISAAQRRLETPYD